MDSAGGSSAASLKDVSEALAGTLAIKGLGFRAQGTARKAELRVPRPAGLEKEREWKIFWARDEPFDTLNAIVKWRCTGQDLVVSAGVMTGSKTISSEALAVRFGISMTSRLAKK